MLSENNNIELFLQKINALTINQPSEAFVEQLRLFINHLLQFDFQKLVYLLYRIDINERVLKNLLHNNPKTDAAIIISNLIIKRQQEKLKAKMQFKRDPNIPEEDKW